MIYVVCKPSLIDLEIQQWTTRGKLTQPERLSERGNYKKVACDSLNTTNNKMKVVRKIRRGLSLAKARVTNWYIAQSDVDSFEVRLRHFTNLFNEQPAACAVLLGYTSP